MLFLESTFLSRPLRSSTTASSQSLMASDSRWPVQCHLHPSATFTVSPIADTGSFLDVTFVSSIGSSASYTVDAGASSASLTIANVDVAPVLPVVSIASSDPSISFSDHRQRRCRPCSPCHLHRLL
eukprot:TRINITY_DN448_c0_g1_i19.p1 TRINITY_DN448_c0_g1~~TRINITY_DN448_c0_g1_i19.p1  ORF type:complete len:126 (-),score=19.50 TRINITY_DN448_c0_g1_i19:220-597(-)